VLRLAQGEKAVQDEHFEVFTVSETPKMAKIRNFQNLYSNLQKQKSNISETVSVAVSTRWKNNILSFLRFLKLKK